MMRGTAALLLACACVSLAACSSAPREVSAQTPLVEPDRNQSSIYDSAALTAADLSNAHTLSTYTSALGVPCELIQLSEPTHIAQYGSVATFCHIDEHWYATGDIRPAMQGSSTP